MAKSWKIAGRSGRKVGKVAGVTRLELAASGVTGRRSNQTELHPRDFSDGFGWGRTNRVHRIQQGLRVNKYPCY